MQIIVVIFYKVVLLLIKDTGNGEPVPDPITDGGEIWGLNSIVDKASITKFLIPQIRPIDNVW